MKSTEARWPMATCIYCSQEFDPNRGEGDIVLPWGTFGLFKGALPFRGLCTQCNNDFSPLDQLLAQSTPLGYYRGVVNPNMGRRQGRGKGRQRGAKYTGTINGQRLLAEHSSKDFSTIEAVDQLILEDTQGDMHHVRLFVGMRGDQVRKAIADLNLCGVKSIAYQVDHKDRLWAESLFADVFPGYSIAEDYTMEPGIYPCQGRVEFRFGPEYFRALAKIAFHFYLVNNRRGMHGDEPEFSGIRTFIQNGGDHDGFFHASGRTFFNPMGTKVGNLTLFSRDWMHVLAVDETKDVVVVCLQFFLGPGSAPPQTYVTLGTLPPSRGVLPMQEGVWGNIFRYVPSSSGNFAGVMEMAPPFTKLR